MSYLQALFWDTLAKEMGAIYHRNGFQQLFRKTFVKLNYKLIFNYIRFTKLLEKMLEIFQM